MATYTPRRLQRSRKSSQQSFRQFLVFTIANQQFALPIESVEKVIQTPALYGDPNYRGFGLISYQGQQVTVIDVEQHLLGVAHASTVDAKTRLEAAHFLILLKVDQGDANSQLLGLPIEQPPQLQRLSQQTITSLPDSYLRWGDIHAVTAVSVEEAETAQQSPTFILEPAAVISTLANQEVILPSELQSSLSPTDHTTALADETIIDEITDLDSDIIAAANNFLTDSASRSAEGLLTEDTSQDLKISDLPDRPAIHETTASIKSSNLEAIASEEPASQVDDPDFTDLELQRESLPEIPDLTDLPDLDLEDVEGLFSVDLETD